MAKLDYGSHGGKGLSYSRLQTLHACPRKFQLENIFGLGGREDSIDFAYGHAVAAGIQCLIVDPTALPRALVATAAAWSMPMDSEDHTSKKSLWYSIRIVEKFHAIISNPATNFLRNYEIAMFPGADGAWKPAVELTFAIRCTNGYVYEGHIDLVLKERGTNKYMVMELKTTKFVEVNDASYKNSDQGLGYSLVVDAIAQHMDSAGSYSVFYLVVKSTRQEIEPLIYPKTRAQRAQFIFSLMLDIEVLELYQSVDIYPMRGESCFNFFRPCAYFGKCHMSDDTLRALATKDPEGENPFSQLKQFDFTFDLDTIRELQLGLMAGEQA